MCVSVSISVSVIMSECECVVGRVGVERNWRVIVIM